MAKVAITQKPPVLLDLGASLNSALAVVEEAANAGAQLIVFPEAFLPGYPTWIWRLKPGGDMALGNEIHARLRANAVDVSKGGLKPLQDLARKRGVLIAIGFHEIDALYSGTTLFNSFALIGQTGELLNLHRKLMPTNPERMVWGQGDARGLHVVDTAIGRVGALVCWENYMPLALYALYAQNLEIHLAPTWDCGPAWLASMQHIAREGGCWVLSGATALRGENVPADFPGRAQLFADAGWINTGDAVIVAPSGKVLAGPMREESGILYGDIDLETARAARKSLDVTGHYARADIFHLEVDRRPRPPATFVDAGE